jgi:hypothetical protein
MIIVIVCSPASPVSIVEAFDPTITEALATEIPSLADIMQQCIETADDLMIVAPREEHSVKLRPVRDASAAHSGYGPGRLGSHIRPRCVRYPTGFV